MQAILLFLNFMGAFLASETGFVRQRTGLPVAWAVGVLVAAAVLFGMPDRAHAACGFWGADCSPGSSTCTSYCVDYMHCSSGQCALYSPGVYKCYCQ